MDLPALQAAFLAVHDLVNRLQVQRQRTAFPFRPNLPEPASCPSCTLLTAIRIRHVAIQPPGILRRTQRKAPDETSGAIRDALSEDTYNRLGCTKLGATPMNILIAAHKKYYQIFSNFP
ncbi:hypothetical protein CBM2615_U10002 [Cupriavidus taiwanensis]|uniref:Uncharacterized protein n=1 Tax=Cupriavidus taiwanensis TaxID=164546 RepID=A0A375EDZ3_9BURK|nr:hypothetical protein CBM2614_U10002 [Cupriavidus taiwanensis]SOZ73287.1 hypothetical protein CBM2615_U10002 [Cupriavidus taiwanensis]SOZ75216.1 hypothetical protein CBM2613_U10118 [Cupriavidus taiwanensis]